MARERAVAAREGRKSMMVGNIILFVFLLFMQSIGKMYDEGTDAHMDKSMK